MMRTQTLSWTETLGWVCTVKSNALKSDNSLPQDNLLPWGGMIRVAVRVHCRPNKFLLQNNGRKQNSKQPVTVTWTSGAAVSTVVKVSAL